LAPPYNNYTDTGIRIKKLKKWRQILAHRGTSSKDDKLFLLFISI